MRLNYLQVYTNRIENKPVLVVAVNKPFPSFPGPLYENEVKCSGFDMKIIFHSHTNKTHFHEKGALGLILKVRVFGTRK